VAEGELAGLYVLLDGCGELEEAEEVGDAGAVFAGARGHLLLGEMEVLREALVGAGLLHGVEVGALEVFDEGEGEEGAVIDFFDDGWDVGPPESGGGAEAALAGDELIAFAVSGSADRYRLEEAVTLERGFQFGEVFRAEFLAGLEGVGADLVDGEIAEEVTGFGSGDCGGGGGWGSSGEERVEPSSEAPRLIGGHVGSRGRRVGVRAMTRSRC
jgi:hypothetical protein